LWQLSFNKTGDSAGKTSSSETLPFEVLLRKVLHFTPPVITAYLLVLITACEGSSFLQDSFHTNFENVVHSQRWRVGTNGSLKLYEVRFVFPAYDLVGADKICY